MTESVDLISKRAAYAALSAAITLHVERAEKLAAEAQALGAEISELESQQPGAQT
jgi:cell division protein FtsB